MLASMLKVSVPENLDASDGLAAAVCHSFQKETGTSNGKKHTGWKSFVQENPKRVL